MFGVYREKGRMNDGTASVAVKISVQEEPAWRRVIDVEVRSDEVDAAYTEVFKEYQKKAKVPGFRPGKAPLSLIQQRLGDQVDQDVLEALIPRTLTQAYRDHKLIPITDPKLMNLHLKQGEPFRYRAVIEVRPEVEPKDYVGLRLEKPKYVVTDEDINEAIEGIRERNAQYVSASQRSARGDVVLCDLIETSTDVPEGKRAKLVDVVVLLDPERIMPEIADGLTGASAGEKRVIQVAYPPDYDDKSLAGRHVTYDATVKDVRVKQLPDVTDEFAAKVAKDIDSVAKLRERVRLDLEAQVEIEARRTMKNEIVNQVLGKNPFELPSSIIEDYLARLLESAKKSQPDVTRENVEAEYRGVGERQVQWEFLYHTIAHKEGIDVSDADVDSWLERFAQNYGLTKEQASKEFAGSARVERVKDTILEHKVLEFLLEKAAVTEKPAVSLIQPPGGIINTDKKRG
jgi:trigger factor